MTVSQHWLKQAKQIQRLQKLDLSDSYGLIQNDGLVALAKAIKTNSSLRELDLSDNDIGFDGVAELAKAIKTNYTLWES